jgi:tetratricopeptide (TPR) repeat protein
VRLAVAISGVLAVGCITATVLRMFSPEFMVTVQQFEISPEVANRLSLSGKSASDIVMDTLNNAATHAAQFHGAEYYAYDGHGTQPVALHQTIRIPVQTSYGIELKGISLDSLIQIYDKIRYQQWIISGDILSSPNGLIARVRLNQDGVANSWETRPSAHASPSELVRNATNMMLTDECPELLGRAYLQQSQYTEAAEVFRQWAIHAPHNSEPTYYLSLAYDYQGKEKEASSLARWSRDIAEHEKELREQRKTQSSTKKPPKASGPKSTPASDLAEVTQAVWETRDTSGSRPPSLAEKLTKLHAVEETEAKFLELSENDPANLTYYIQWARTLDKEAAIEASAHSASPQAYETEKQAMALLEKALRVVPENGGLHEQHAILLQHLVAFAKADNKDPQVIRTNEMEEVAEFKRALELRPIETSPLWAAVYALLDLNRDEDAIDLAKTITLLQPDSTAANSAYVFALASAITVPGNEPERKTEVETHLKPLLEEADNIQLQTLWYAFKKNHDSQSLSQVAAVGKRRFPKDPTFQECRPTSKPSGTFAIASTSEEKKKNTHLDPSTIQEVAANTLPVTNP